MSESAQVGGLLQQDSAKLLQVPWPLRLASPAASAKPRCSAGQSQLLLLAQKVQQGLSGVITLREAWDMRLWEVLSFAGNNACLEGRKECALWMTVTANNNDSCLKEMRIWGISVQVSSSIQRPEKEMFCMSPEKELYSGFWFWKRSKCPGLFFWSFLISCYLQKP